MQYEDKDPVNLVAPNVINDGREHSVTIQKFPNYAQIKVKLKIYLLKDTYVSLILWKHSVILQKFPNYTQIRVK